MDQGESETFEICQDINHSVIAATDCAFVNDQGGTIDVPSGLDVPYINDGLIFVRKGSQSVQADTETIRRMVLDKANEAQRWERRASLGLDAMEVEKSLVSETVRLWAAGYN